MLGRVTRFSLSRYTTRAVKQMAPLETASTIDGMPRGSWDSHMHVTDADRYPLAADAIYRPPTCTVADAAVFERSRLGMRNVVVVQPSVYGNDNSCTLDAVRDWPAAYAAASSVDEPPGRAVGVVTFDPVTTPAATLEAWHALGVRGVRVNLQSVGRTMEVDELAATLRACADAVRELGWVVQVQVYVPLATVAVLEEIVPTLRVRFCIDHLGYPTPPADGQVEYDPYELPGFAALVRLLQGESMTFVKLSAPYRMSKAAGYGDLDVIIREILRVAGKTRVVYASDFPHTRFEGLDIRPWTKHVIDLCGRDQELVNRVFRDNAEVLWCREDTAERPST